MPNIPLKQIIVGERHRKDLGDIPALAESIERLGLLQPIGITLDYRLIFGERRFRAFQHLGRKSIPAHYIDVPSIVEGEWAENEDRKAFTVSERVAIAKAIEREMGERRGAPEGNKNRAKDVNSKRENFPALNSASEQGRTRQIAAQKAGLGSGKTFEHAAAIVEAAEAEPEKFGDLVEKMDRTGKVNGAYADLKKRREPENGNGKAAPKRAATTVLTPEEWAELYQEITVLSDRACAMIDRLARAHGYTR